MRDYLQLTPSRTEEEFSQVDLECNRPGFRLKGEAADADLYPQFRVTAEEDPVLLHEVMLAWRKSRQHPPPLLAMLASPQWFNQLCFVQDATKSVLSSKTSSEIVNTLQALGNEEARAGYQSPMGLFADVLVKPNVVLFCPSDQHYLSDGESLVGAMQLRIRLLQAEGIHSCIVRESEWRALPNNELARKLFLHPKLFAPEQTASALGQDWYLKIVPPEQRPVDPAKFGKRPELTRLLPF